jgi:hypothetical protein
MITKEQFLAAVEIINKYKQQCIEKIESYCNDDIKFIKSNFIDKDDYIKAAVNDVITVRLYNVLMVYFRTYHSIRYDELHLLKFSDLSYLSMKDFRKVRNVGKRSYDELKEILNKLNIIPKD